MTPDRSPRIISAAISKTCVEGIGGFAFCYFFSAKATFGSSGSHGFFDNWTIPNPTFIDKMKIPLHRKGGIALTVVHRYNCSIGIPVNLEMRSATLGPNVRLPLRKHEI